MNLSLWLLLLLLLQLLLMAMGIITLGTSSLYTRLHRNFWACEYWGTKRPSSSFPERLHQHFLRENRGGHWFCFHQKLVPVRKVYLGFLSAETQREHNTCNGTPVKYTVCGTIWVKVTLRQPRWGPPRPRLGPHRADSLGLVRCDCCSSLAAGMCGQPRLLWCHQRNRDSAWTSSVVAWMSLAQDKQTQDVHWQD